MGIFRKIAFWSLILTIFTKNARKPNIPRERKIDTIILGCSFIINTIINGLVGILSEI